MALADQLDKGQNSLTFSLDLRGQSTKLELRSVEAVAPYSKQGVHSVGHDGKHYCADCNRDLSPLYVDGISKDAARWQALLNCSRIRVLGYARGGPEGKDGPIRHIGFEWTNGQKPYNDDEIKEAVARLIEFTDSLPSSRISSRE